MPLNCRILDVQFQFGKLMMWCEVEYTAGIEPVYQDRRIWIFGTNHPLPEHVNLHYITTVQQDGGALIWHIYEELSTS